MLRHRSLLVIALRAALAGTPAPASAEGHTGFEPLWLAPVPAAASPAAAPVPATGSGAPALLGLPAGWAPGDAAAVVVAGRRSAKEGARDRLVAALLREGAAVLELDVPAARDPLPRVFAALAALRQDAGAGLVVALGYGAGGDAALRAAEEGAAALRLGADGLRFAAAGSLGPGRVAFAAGAAPPAEVAWPSRAPLLCAALAAAAESAEVGRTCAAALAPPGAPPRGPSRTGVGP